MRVPCADWFEPDRARRVGIAASCFLLGTVGVQFVPLLGEMGYDYALLVAVLLTLFGASIVLSLRRSSLLIWTGRASLLLALLVLLAGLIGTLNMLRVPSCAPAAAWGHVLLHGLGAIPWIAATCIVCREAGTRRPGLLYALLVLWSIVAGLLWLYAQPAIHLYHPWLGHVAASIYDESIADVAPHLWFRLYTTLCAMLFLLLLALHRRVTLQRATLALALLSAVLGMWSARGVLGFEISRAQVEQVLGGMVETENFVIFYDAERFSPSRAHLLAYDHEARHAELAEFWARLPGYRVRSYVYGDREQKGRLMGGRQTMVAKIWLGEMHILWRGVGDEMLAHELAHLFLRDEGRGPLRLSLFGIGLPNMGLTEGAAVAAAWGARELTYHGWAAALHELDMAPDLERSFSAWGFWRQPSGRVYTLMGSFVRWLIEERGGPERFRRAYGWSRFEAEYGESIPDLLASWRAWLAERPLSDGELEVARERYARGALFERVCARTTSTRMDNVDRALAGGRRGEAREELEGLMQRDAARVPPGQSRRIRLWAAERFRWLGAPEVAIALLEQLSAEDEVSVAQREGVLLLLADMLWEQGEMVAARELLEELEEGVSASHRRAAAARLAGLDAEGMFPRKAAAIRQHLVLHPRPSQSARLAALLEAFHEEGSAWAAYLVLLALDHEAPHSLLDALEAKLEDTAAGTPEDLRVPGSAQRALWEPHLTALRMLREPLPPCARIRAARDRWSPRSAVHAELAMWEFRCRRGLVP